MRQMNLLRRAGHARRVHGREEELQLMNVHFPAPIAVRRRTKRPRLDNFCSFSAT
jgi:hypothetical protein